jgi:hypothetical protein
MDIAEVYKAYDLPFLYECLHKYEASGNQTMVKPIVAELQRRADSAPVQTEALYNSGELYTHKVRMDDDTGRTATMHSGDPAVWMRQFMPEPGNVVKITSLQAYRDEEHERERQHIMRLGIETQARMNRSERTMADSGENSSPPAKGPAVDKAIERHGKALGFFDGGKFF